MQEPRGDPTAHLVPRVYKASQADETFYELWQHIKGAKHWDGNNLWPKHFDQQTIAKLESYYRAMPEEFYLNSGLPVVTPDVFQEFVRAYKGRAFHLSELCSGSGRLSFHAF